MGASGSTTKDKTFIVIEFIFYSMANITPNKISEFSLQFECVGTYLSVRTCNIALVSIAITCVVLNQVGVSVF